MFFFLCIQGCVQVYYKNHSKPVWTPFYMRYQCRCSDCMVYGSFLSFPYVFFCLEINTKVGPNQGGIEESHDIAFLRFPWWSGMMFTLFLLFVGTVHSVGTQTYMAATLLTISYTGPINFPVKTPGRLSVLYLERLPLFCRQESVFFFHYSPSFGACFLLAFLSRLTSQVLKEHPSV